MFKKMCLEIKFQPVRLRNDRNLREQLGVQKSNLGFQLLYLLKLFQSSSESDSALEDSSSGEDWEEPEDAITPDGPTKADQLVNLLKNVLSPSREDAQGMEKPL